MSDLQIIHLQDQFRDELEGMMKEYLDWVYQNVKSEYDIDVLPEDNYMEALDMEVQDLMKLYFDMNPEVGCLMLLKDGERICGMGMVHKLDQRRAELKRMYVRPQERGKGLGRILIDNLLQWAKENGSSIVLLDSARFMKSAHRLYKKVGFTLTDPYPESEATPEYHEYVYFMEMKIEQP